MSNHIVHRDGDQLFTTSEIIAERVQVTHQAVMKLVDGYQDDLSEFGEVGFEIRAGYNNAQVRFAKLNEQQSTLVLAFMRNTDIVVQFKKDLVKGFYEMAQQLQQPPQPAELSRSQLAQMVIDSENEKAELSQQLEIAAPKAEYVDNHVADNDYLLFRTVASNLGVGENTLRQVLRFMGWIYVDSQRRRNTKGEVVTEYQWAEYSHKKDYFFRSINHQAPLFKGNSYFTLKITVPGVAAITRLVKKIEDEFGSLGESLPELEGRYNARRAA